MLTKFSQRYRCGSFRHAKSRVGTGLISTAHVNIRLPRLEMRMTARLIHRENRSKAGVGPLKQIAPSDLIFDLRRTSQTLDLPRLDQVAKFGTTSHMAQSEFQTR